MNTIIIFVFPKNQYCRIIKLCHNHHVKIYKNKHFNPHYIHGWRTNNYCCLYRFLPNLIV